MMMCEECRIGRLQPVPAPYVNEFDGQIMVVPDVPAFQCDVCGELHYDEQFLRALYRLMDPLTESSLMPDPRQPSPTSKQQPSPLPSQRSS